MEPVKKVEPAKKLALSVGRLTMFFAATGAVAGLISGLISSANIRFNIWTPLIALFLFYVSYKLAAQEKIKNRFLMTPVEESEAEKKFNVLMTGFWSYFIMWLVLWVMVYTLLLVH